MNIGKMNERITIEQAVTVRDQIGNHYNTWEPYFSCGAYAYTYVVYEKGEEVTTENRSIKFSVRSCTETKAVTSTGFRIRFHDEVYNILAVDQMNYNHKEIRFQCRREARS